MNVPDKIGRWTIDQEKLRAYWKHIEQRIYKLDERDSETKEQERTRLHDEVTTSAHLVVGEEADFLIALREATDKEFEGLSELANFG